MIVFSPPNPQETMKNQANPNLGAPKKDVVKKKISLTLDPLILASGMATAKSSGESMSAFVERAVQALNEKETKPIRPLRTVRRSPKAKQSNTRQD